MATILIRPSKIQVNSSRRQALNLTCAGAGWTSGTTFTLSGVADVTTVVKVVNGPGSARIVVTTAGASPGTLTVSDGTNSGTVSVAAIAPSAGRGLPPRRSRPDGEPAA